MRVTTAASLFVCGFCAATASGQTSGSCQLQLHGKGELKAQDARGGGSETPFGWGSWTIEVKRCDSVL